MVEISLGVGLKDLNCTSATWFESDLPAIFDAPPATLGCGSKPLSVKEVWRCVRFEDNGPTPPSPLHSYLKRLRDCFFDHVWLRNQPPPFPAADAVAFTAAEVPWLLMCWAVGSFDLVRGSSPASRLWVSTSPLQELSKTAVLTT